MKIEGTKAEPDIFVTKTLQKIFGKIFKPNHCLPT